MRFRIATRAALMPSLVVLAALSAVVQAEKSAGPATELGQPGEVLLQDRFDRAVPGEDWNVAKGEWTIAEGSLVGKELPDDKHAAVATIGGTHRNSIVRFRFQLNGAKQFALSLNKAKGHLFRVVVNEQGLTLTLDKDKSNPNSKAQVFAKAQGVIEPNHWHTLQLEMVGRRVVAQTDSGLKVSGQHADLDCDKPGYRFVVSGSSIKIDDLLVTAVN